MKLFCAVVGAAGSAFCVQVDASDSVDDLKDAIATKQKLSSCAACKLQLYLAKKNKKNDNDNDAWLPSNDRDVITMRTGVVPDKIQSLLVLAEELDPADLIGDLFGQAPTKQTIHVLVAVPPLEDAAADAVLGNQDVVWLGTRGGSRVRGEGIDLEDPRTLARTKLITTEILGRLDKTHVLLVKSPPMTGKTALATLLSRALVDKYTQHNNKEQKMVVCNFSALRLYENERFEETFKRQCGGMEWAFAVATLPTQTKYVVNLVVDDTHVLYDDDRACILWELVKYLLSNAAYNVRIVMFASSSSAAERICSTSPIHLEDDELVLSSTQLNFSHAEVVEFVTKRFTGISCFHKSSLSGAAAAAAFGAFCGALKDLTSGHVGLCATAIHTLNQVYQTRNSFDLPSPKEWTTMLQSGALYDRDDGALFVALASTRAVKELQSLEMDELDQLESHDPEILEKCLQKGILVRTKNRKLDFSSPVMWRFYVKLQLGRVMRSTASNAPQGLPEMVTRVVEAIDYDRIRRQSLCVGGSLPLEKAWQMEFYKAAYRSTPTSFVTSVDVGGSCGGSLTGGGGRGMELTIRGGGGRGGGGSRRDNFVWGIRLLFHDQSDVAGHIDLFANESLGWSDCCLIDFRCVESMDTVAMARIAADMRRCDKLFVVCYDAHLASVAVFNSSMDVVYRIRSG